MKQIGIFERHYHVKFLHTITRITNTTDTHVTIFTTQHIYDQLIVNLTKPDDYTFVIKQPHESVHNFMKRVETYCTKNIDLLFINTIQTTMFDLVHYLGFRPRCTMILTIHMTNHWLRAKYALNMKNLLRSLDANLSLFFIKTVVLPKFHAINVIYPPTKTYLEDHKAYRKPIFTLPFNFYDEKKHYPKPNTDDITRIVISGKIEKFRRDYNTALEVFEHLSTKYPNHLQLSLLGQPVGAYGEKIITKSQQLKEQGHNIHYPTDYVSEEEYNQILAECDLIFAPLKIQKIIDTGIEEIYGLSEGSAIPFEAVQNQKPLIVPQDFQVIDELQSSTIQYADADDLKRQLETLLQSKTKLTKIKHEAQKNASAFSLEKLQQYFTKEILEKLDQL